MEKYSKQELEKLILEQNETYSSIGRQFGVSGNAIKKVAKKLGIPLPRRRKINDNENFKNFGRKINSLVNTLSDEDFIEITSKSLTWKEIGTKLGYKSKVLSSNVKNSIEERCLKLGVELNLQEMNLIDEKTKSELFKSRKNWQSARSAIRKHAKIVFAEYNPVPKCAICGYSTHVEIAHKKAVSEFDNHKTIREINSIENLIGLCPNHHWEYDNGLIKL
jgi:hypothetical protein